MLVNCTYPEKSAVARGCAHFQGFEALVRRYPLNIAARTDGAGRGIAARRGGVLEKRPVCSCRGNAKGQYRKSKGSPRHCSVTTTHRTEVSPGEVQKSCKQAVVAELGRQWRHKDVVAEGDVPNTQAIYLSSTRLLAGADLQVSAPNCTSDRHAAVSAHAVEEGLAPGVQRSRAHH